MVIPTTKATAPTWVWAKAASTGRLPLKASRKPARLQRLHLRILGVPKQVEVGPRHSCDNGDQHPEEEGIAHPPAPVEEHEERQGKAYQGNVEGDAALPSGGPVAQNPVLYPIEDKAHHGNE
jgi:hypothetical protein